MCPILDQPELRIKILILKLLPQGFFEALFNVVGKIKPKEGKILNFFGPIVLKLFKNIMEASLTLGSNIIFPYWRSLVGSTSRTRDNLSL